jgi:aminocarboxymuconate-semialdehyde decarboxylase
MQNHMTPHVDIHTHVLLRETMGGAGPLGPELKEEPDGTASFRVGNYKLRSRDGHMLDPRFHNPHSRLADMDAKGIDVMGVSVSPLTYLYWAPKEIGIQFSSLQNDAMARFCRAAPERLFFFATVPLQDIDASVVELDRAVRKLGARGLNLGQTDAALGLFPDDPKLWPLYDKAQSLGIPILVHPYPPGMEGTGTGENPLTWIAGYLHQSTMTGASMVLGGVFDEFPKLRVILPHGGGAFPYQFGRFEYAASRMPRIRAKRKIRDYLPNIYFDCLVHDPRARRYLVEFAGADHVLVGDNYLGWDAVDGFAMVRELALPKSEEDKIMGLNCVELFRLR